jgi:hypothetical protein|tara:strand:- start:2525 stop:2902 length:378 start_codon:yes stop_codon:yes gene_type:complete
MLQALLSPLMGIVGTAVKGHLDKKKAQAEFQVETIRAQTAVRKKVVDGELEWNHTMAEASKGSLKDEWLTLLVSIPLVLAFTGHTEAVERGFQSLEAMPSFYQTAVGVVFAASFGVQQLTKMFKK